MTQETASLKEDQAKLARLLKFLTMVFELGNIRLMELTPEWLEEYSHEMSSLWKKSHFAIHQYWHEELTPDHQIIFIDHLLMNVIRASDLVCNGTQISDWSKSDSFAAWKICILDTELHRLTTTFYKRISFGTFTGIYREREKNLQRDKIKGPFDKSLMRDDFLAEAARIIRDPDFGFGEIKGKIDFDVFKQTGKWLNLISRENLGIAAKLGVFGRTDKEVEAMLESIVNGTKLFKEVADDLEKKMKPSDFKNRLVEAGRFHYIFRELMTKAETRNQLADEMGVDRKTVSNWEAQFLKF